MGSSNGIVAGSLRSISEHTNAMNVTAVALVQPFTKSRQKGAKAILPEPKKTCFMKKDSHYAANNGKLNDAMQMQLDKMNSLKRWQGLKAISFSYCTRLKLYKLSSCSQFLEKHG